LDEFNVVSKKIEKVAAKRNRYVHDPVVMESETGKIARMEATADLRNILAQGYLPLIYTNTSRQACLLRGVPGADLHGPADPNGPVYTLFRQQSGIKDMRLQPGASASARLVVLSDQDGSFGSLGSRNWVPTQLVTIPPGETTALTVPWPAGLTVSRQDSATHPGSWIEPFAAS